MSRPARRAEGEAGVTLILFALALIAIMTMVAIVIDLSNVRNTRQDSKSTTDAATSAGLLSLAPDGVARPWSGVCSALDYLKANRPDVSFSDITYWDGQEGVGTNAGDPIQSAPNNAPCSSLANQKCLPNSPTTWAWIRVTDGDFIADLRSGYNTPDALFPEDAGSYSGDNGVALNGGCDQLAVIVSDRDPALFGGAAGATGYDTKTRSVGRVVINFEGEASPAFLMLERNRCGVLSEAVGTGGGSGIIVKAASSTQPGLIHVDSVGTNGCSGSSEGNYTLFSSGIGSTFGIQALGSDGDLLADPPVPAAPGIIALHALQVDPANAHGWATTAGVSPAPTAGRVVSRQPIDDKYNPSARTQPTISDIHEDAYDDATQSVTTATTAGFTIVSTCNNHTPTLVEQAALKIFVNCPDGYSPRDASFSLATEVIFNGPVQVSNGRSLFMPLAQRVVVGGTSTRGLELSGGGRLGINSGLFLDTDAALDGACIGDATSSTPSVISSRKVQLTIFGGAGAGALDLAGRAALCRTSVYLAGPKRAFYARQFIDDGSYDATCLPGKPCPKPAANGNTVTDAHFRISGRVHWSAPNTSSGQPDAGAAGIEDLALWTESAQVSESRPGSFLSASGVFFLPNARFEMRGISDANPQDAQFIARSLKLFQGTLTMQPTPNNTVQVPVLAGIGMVR